MSIPRTEPELVIWLNHFAQTLNAHGARLGFTPAEIATVSKDAAMLDYLISDLLPTYKSGLDARYAYKNLIKDGPLGETGGDPPPLPRFNDPPDTVLPGVMPRLRQTIQRIRTAPAYTDDIGNEFGITGTERTSHEATTTKPTAKAIAESGHQVRIDFTKQRFDGVLIESRRLGETAWTLLGTDNYSPYLDSRPPVTANQPETREYRLRYLSHDEAVGDWSDIISATTRA